MQNSELDSDPLRLCFSDLTQQTERFSHDKL